MFNAVQPAPPDPILGLTEAFRADPNPAKINLAVGVFKDAEGNTPVLASVKAAEQRLVDDETTKSYMPIDGSPAYGKLVQTMLFGADHDILANARARTANTPGGTGALRVAADYLSQNHAGATLWLSNPTWANHHGIFNAAGVETQTYAYLDPNTNALDFDGVLAAIQDIPAGDVVLLHGCCHNPTGVDPSLEQWKAIASAVAERGILPIVDFAYQGFGQGLEEDAAGLRAVAAACGEFLVCSSFSKNFGLYRERVGALTLVAQDSDTADTVISQVKAVIRRNYSNPPAHGASVVTTIMSDDAPGGLRSQWEAELAAMRDRINEMRSAFKAGLDERGVNLTPEGNDFVTQQNGMFTMSGLSKDHVAALRENHAIYIVGSGRINVAGMTPTNLPVLCDAIADVMQPG
ncbi:amino acid aminotransferase [Algisphaera agarilytica]|uniref:Aminotransferase n=1 Tax=Algisphaera agarilytica TaxID=1385975 RepID=A0A7X0H7V0_9BACT|nr:amino acid aminotransferase [Algisphaera agarilytica]MBB6430723.1 aspartate/tyrosine/aromatic aminotransferase [Algisphaera agarilytica]